MINRREFAQMLSREVLILDGGMGTLLQEFGLEPGAAPESMNLAKPDAVEDIHRTYVAAGAGMVLTNTFGATRLKLESHGLQGKVGQVNRAAVSIARRAVGGKALVGVSVGPTGRSFYPLGDMTFEEAYGLFAEQVKHARKAGPDAIVIETMADLRETRAAAMAARDNFAGPVLVQMTFSEGDATLTGVKPECAACALEALDIDAVGANCSLGPEELLPVMQAMARVTDMPLLVQPNAGLPELRSGKTHFPGSPDLFARYAVKFVEAGVNIIGGCCGSGPSHISALRDAVTGRKPQKRPRPAGTMLCGKSTVFMVGEGRPFGLVGERINPTANKLVRAAVESGQWAVLRSEAEAQVKAGASMVDVNVGVPGVDQRQAMRQAVQAVQAGIEVPICLDSSDLEALEKGLMEVEGKPLLNSTTAEKRHLGPMVRLARRYGAAFVGLTIDESGIPKDARGRVAIAGRIVSAAERAGIRPENVFIDPLALSVAAEPAQAAHSLEAVRAIKEKLGSRVLMGISNVSHGLPGRSGINAQFLTMALAHGLDLPIINPFSDEVKAALAHANLLLGRDPFAKAYLEGREVMRGRGPRPSLKSAGRAPDVATRMKEAVLEGNRDELISLIDGALDAGTPPMEIGEKGLLPALAELGKKFKSREFFLPQVVLSAQAVQAAYGRIRKAMGKNAGPSRGRVIMATVKGDVHEIGKNIVVTLLENHGFEVRDLGKNVDASDILSAALEWKAEVVGLSALMTTTMLEMPRVISALRAGGCKARVMVGGAVVTRDFSRKAMADGFAPDAMGAVDEAARLVEELRKSRGHARQADSR